MSLSDDIATFWEKTAHPVYNSLGRNIGYFIDDAQLARGQIQLYAGETIGSADTWQVKSPFGAIVPASTYLVNKGLQPVWLSQSDAQQLLNDTSGSGLPGLPQLTLPSLNSVGASPVLWAALALAALALIARLRRPA